MKIAIVHQHLNRGGVTQVIANHLAALASTGDACPVEHVGVFYGGRRDGWSVDETASRPFALTLHEVPGLDYDAVGTLAPEELESRTRASLKAAGFSDSETVVHVHNHSLGKNVEWPGALARLSASGFPLLLQIHDFAEDFRPENYGQIARHVGSTDPGEIASYLYPQAPQMHYAVLNQRDARVLAVAGIPSDRMHLLPNPVAPFGDLPNRFESRAALERQFGIQADQRFVLYPVRGIRRKNVGELLLWSAAFRDRATFGLTLAPLNPVEQPSYERWKSLATKLRLPLAFELGGPGGLGFTENLAAADLLVTTSVAEGFGMVFLEAWLAGRALIGRDLPEITADFAQNGLKLPHLQSRITVPVDWVGRESLADSVTTAFVDVHHMFGRPEPPSDQIRDEFFTLIADGVDFAQLPSRHQQLVIEHVAADASARQSLIEKNAWMEAALDRIRSVNTLISENATVVHREYSLSRSADRLLEAYRAAASSQRSASVESPGRGEAILSEFLSLTRFHTVRIEA